MFIKGGDDFKIFQLPNSCEVKCKLQSKPLYFFGAMVNVGILIGILNFGYSK